MDFIRVFSTILLASTLFFTTASIAETSLGNGASALLGGDLTDPQDDASNNTLTGYDFIQIISSNEPFFGSEGSYNIFDNTVGGGDTKWCCDTPAPEHTVAVEFANQYVMTHFTITSGNDSQNDREPDIWHIEGSNDGTTWTPIYTYNNDGTSPFASLLEVLRYDGAGTDFATPAPFSWFRYRVESTVGGGLHQINEIEFFGDLFVPPVPTAAPIPTLSEWSILLLSLLLGFVAFWYKPNALVKRN